MKRAPWAVAAPASVSRTSATPPWPWGQPSTTHRPPGAEGSTSRWPWEMISTPRSSWARHSSGMRQPSAARRERHSGVSTAGGAMPLGSPLSYTRTSTVQPRARALKSRETAIPTPGTPPPTIASRDPLVSLPPFIIALAPPPSIGTSWGYESFLKLVPLGRLGGPELRRAVHHHPVAPLAFGLVERLVRGPQQLVGALARVGGRVVGDSHAHAQPEGGGAAVRAGDLHAPQARADALGEHRRLGRRLVGQEGDELIASEARREVHLAQVGAQQVGERQDGAVAHVMAHAVVDGLEVIQIDDHHGQGVVIAVGALELLLQPCGQGAEVGQARERVRLGHLLQALLLLALAQGPIDARHELAGARRLVHEVHRAHLQALLQGGLVRIAREEDDRHGLRGPVVLQGLEHHQSVLVIQEAIQEDQVRAPLAGEFHAGVPTVRAHDVDPGGDQLQPALAPALVLIHEQDPGLLAMLVVPLHSS